MSELAELAYRTYHKNKKDWVKITTNPFEYKIQDRLGFSSSYKFHKDKPLNTIHQQRDSNLYKEFLRLSKEWKESTNLISDWSRIVYHPSYQKIIGLGPEAIPFILKEMQDNGGQWFWALEALARENPIIDADAGKIKKMTEAWINWGIEKGYI